MPKPILQSLILADHVYEDKLTGKRIIAGIFNRIIRGVRVFKEIPPAPQQPTPPQQQYPAQPPVASQPPYAPQTEIVAPSPYTPPPEPAAQPPQWDQPQQPAPPAPTSQPNPAATPPTQFPPPAAPVTPPQSAPLPPMVAAPPPAAPTSPGTIEQSPTPRQQPPARTTPPPPPAQPPLQPGQRVLEIPPTGFQSGSPFAYLSLTEVRGVTPLVLQLINLQDDTQLFRSDLRVDCPNPLYTIEITVPLPPITPPQAGIYALEVLYNNEILGSLRIVVEDAPQ